MYYLATGLIGFRSSTLRVRLLEVRGGCAFIITADLLDAGTKLALDPAQLEPIAEAPAPVMHSTGLVALG